MSQATVLTVAMVLAGVFALCITIALSAACISNALAYRRQPRGNGCAGHAHPPADGLDLETAGGLNLELLEQPVEVPPGHPERFPELDGLDGQLAEVHDVSWPREEWRLALRCPHFLMTGYATHAEALMHEPDGEPVEAECGLIHVRQAPVVAQPAEQEEAAGHGRRRRRRRRARARRPSTSP